MKIRYFEDTDTLYIEFSDAPVVETKDLDENTILDLSTDGKISALTLEHASARIGVPQVSFERVAA